MKLRMRRAAWPLEPALCFRMWKSPVHLSGTRLMHVWKGESSTATAAHPSPTPRVQTASISSNRHPACSMQTATISMPAGHVIRASMVLAIMHTQRTASKHQTSAWTMQKESLRVLVRHAQICIRCLAATALHLCWHFRLVQWLWQCIAHSLAARARSPLRHIPTAASRLVRRARVEQGVCTHPLHKGAALPSLQEAAKRALGKRLQREKVASTSQICWSISLRTLLAAGRVK